MYGGQVVDTTANFKQICFRVASSCNDQMRILLIKQRVVGIYGP